MKGNIRIDFSNLPMPISEDDGEKGEIIIGRLVGKVSVSTSGNDKYLDIDYVAGGEDTAESTSFFYEDEIRGKDQEELTEFLAKEIYAEMDENEDLARLL